MDHRTGAAPDGAGPALRALQRVVAVRPEELRVVLWCWLYIFSAMSSYSIMRPMRDQMGVAGGVNNLPWLFTGTLIGMLLVNLPFAYLVRKLPRRRFIPITYHFFAVNILLFAAALHLATPEQTVWIGRAFFIWVSIYNLFVISVFWQVNVDLFDPEQGKRLFGFIAVGATLGVVSGATITATLAQFASPTALLIGSAVLLEIAVLCAGRLLTLSPSLQRAPGAASATPAAERAIGGGVLAGVWHVLNSLYISNVAVFMFLFTTSSTFIYVQQAAAVSHSFTDRGAQTAFFATVDLCVNLLTLGLQLFFSGRIIRGLGVPLALALLPALTILGFSALAITPSLLLIAGFQILRRASDYAIARPTREVLFTVMPREDRFKTKGLIDTLVYRLGDQFGVWSTRWLGAIGGQAVELVAVAIAAVWLVNALWLGRRQRALEAAPAATALAAD